MVLLILIPVGLSPGLVSGNSGNGPRLHWFHALREGNFLYIKRGLLERREATIPLSRIQAIRVSEGVLRQPFGLASLRVESAGYGEDVGVSTMLFPLLPRDEVEELLADAAPEFAVKPALKSLPRRALRRYVFRSTFSYLVIALAGTLVSFLAFESALGLLALFLLPPAAAYGWLCYRDAGWAFEEDRLVVRYRSLGRKTAIAPRRRLQSREVSTQPFPAACKARHLSGRGRFGIGRFRPAGYGPRRGSGRDAGGRVGAGRPPRRSMRRCSAVRMLRDSGGYQSGLQWDWTPLEALQPVSTSAFQLSLAEVLKCAISRGQNLC